MAAEYGDWEAAEDDAASAALLYPSLPVFPFYRGTALLQLEQTDQAERQLKAARNLLVDQPDFESQILGVLAEVERGRGNDTASDQYFEQAIALVPDAIVEMNNYAYYLSIREVKLDRALELAATVVSLAPNDPTFEDTYAWVLYKSGDSSEALSWIRLALFHTGNAADFTLLDHAGDIALAAGDQVAARDYWMRALEMASGEVDRAIIEDKIRVVID